jgi:peptidoglycan-associated lipoprotein
MAALMVVACASSPKSDSAAAKSIPASDAKTPVVAAAISAPVSAENLELSKLNAELQALQKQSDFFDTAKYAIKPEYQEIIKKQAEFLKAHSNDVVTLAGNADERGSEKYNLTLSGKRAKAVQKSLEKYGVPAKQIKLVALGKDHPRLTCHEEKCWKENRRVDFEHRV